MFFQEYRFCPPPCRNSTDGRAGVRCRVAVPFVGDQGQAVGDPETSPFAVRSAQCSRTSSRPTPRAHVTQRKTAVFRMVSKRRCTALPTICDRAARFAEGDDRQGIIDAAYGCLYEPHSGPIPVAAILERAGLVHPGLLPPLRVEGRAVPRDAAAGSRCVGRSAGPHRRRVRPADPANS